MSRCMGTLQVWFSLDTQRWDQFPLGKFSFCTTDAIGGANCVMPMVLLVPLLVLQQLLYVAVHDQWHFTP